MVTNNIGDTTNEVGAPHNADVRSKSDTSESSTTLPHEAIVSFRENLIKAGRKVPFFVERSGVWYVFSDATSYTLVTSEADAKKALG